MKTVFVLLVSLVAMNTFADTTRPVWNYGDCEERTPGNAKIRDLPNDVCRQKLGSKPFWNYGDCEERTPGNAKIRDLPNDVCRKALGYQQVWVYGDCEERTPGNAKIRDLPNDVCRSYVGMVQPRSAGSPRSASGSKPAAATSVELKDRKGDPYSWANGITNTTAASSGGLSQSLRKASSELIRIYKDTILSLDLIIPIVEEGEDRDKVNFLKDTLKIAIGVIMNQDTTQKLNLEKILPATHWRIRESARMILVMSEIVAPIIKELRGIRTSKNTDEEQQRQVGNFTQAMDRFQATIDGVRATSGLKGFVGDSSKASNPLVKIFQLQLLQIKSALGDYQDPQSTTPRYARAFAALEKQISILKDMNAKGDASSKYRAEVKTLADIWNAKGEASVRELVGRAIMMSPTTKADAEMLYLAAASLGTIHKRVTFELPTAQPMLNNK